MSMIVAFIIFSTGASLFRESLQKVFNPAVIDFTPVLIPVLAISIAAKLFLYFYYGRLSKKLNSSVLKASAADCIIDVISSVIILISMLIYRFISIDLDAYLGLLVSVLVIISALKIMIDCKNSILGTAPDSELIARISDLVGSSDNILEVHDIIVHNYGGGKTLASLHVGVDGNKSVFEIHDIIDAIEHRLKDELDVDCTIHPDPMDPKDKNTSEVFERILSVITKIDPRLTIHDFRIITDSTPHTLDFDILQPFELTSDISHEIHSKLAATFPKYQLHITIDKG